ncbi:hypothetical protein GCM10010302_37160 [Streptomyces polychromogenes]|uniref:Uncharacterized protein n=1 Tax=Streptomyces polychromogenes TaxID=67342 RepID=A0ABN0VG38_9ACTN
MNGKLTGLVGIFAAALVLGLGVTVHSSETGAPAGHEVLAEGRGPAAPSPAPSPAVAP